MGYRVAAVVMSLLLCSVSGPGNCAAPTKTGLQLRLSNQPLAHQPLAQVHAQAIPATEREPRFALRAPAHRDERLLRAEPTVRERALQSLLSGAEMGEMEPMPGDAQSQSRAEFRFERRGSAFKDLSRGYKAMCDNVSQKIWDDPNGKRIKFDSAGKPGVAVVIPIR